MKKTFFLLFLAILFVGSSSQKPSNTRLEGTLPEGSITFMLASDMGRHGVSEQKNIAEIMGQLADDIKVDFLAVAGDPIHDKGVTCVEDDEWKLKIEDVYTAQSLHDIPWYVISGNHEYNGSVQAILDYSNISDRWNAPERYFSFSQKIGNSDENCLFVFIDTTPLIDSYRNDKKYSDAGEQCMERQLFWLDSTLVASNSRWKIVIGHHPIYCGTTKEIDQRIDMQERVGNILENRNVDFYIGGHIHNFQYVKPEGKSVNYIVNSSASRSREVVPADGVVFSNSDPGFSLFNVSQESVQFYFINHTGETVYFYQNEK